MASIGTIVTRVYTSKAQVPIQGATVAITQKSTDGRSTLLAIRISDENGRTLPVRVRTPDPAESESPGNVVGFASCDIWTEAPGYEMSLIENVQVFPDTETLQELELIPLPEQADPNTTMDRVDVPPQDL